MNHYKRNNLAASLTLASMATLVIASSASAITVVPGGGPRPGPVTPPMVQPAPGQPGYIAPQPGQPGYVPPQPGYNPAQPGYMPPQPGYNPAQPGYMPPQPGYNPPQPGYVMPQPGYVPHQPGFNPGRPGFAPGQPGGFQPGQPGYGFIRPHYGDGQFNHHWRDRFGRPMSWYETNLGLRFDGRYYYFRNDSRPCFWGMDNNWHYYVNNGGTYYEDMNAPIVNMPGMYDPNTGMQIISASYGLNCNFGLQGNLTSTVQSTCMQQIMGIPGPNGCQFAVSTSWFRDPAFGCAKDLRIEYSCSGVMQPMAYVPAEANNIPVYLNCPSFR